LVTGTSFAEHDTERTFDVKDDADVLEGGATECGW
jgi:hypothetical protein